MNTPFTFGPNLAFTWGGQKAFITCINDDGIEYKIKRASKDTETLSFDELMNEIRAGEICFAGTDPEKDKSDILCAIKCHIHKMQFDKSQQEHATLLLEKEKTIEEIKAEAEKEKTLANAPEEEQEFKDGGVMFDITTKNGIVKEIRSRYGKLVQEVKVGDKIYRRNKIYKAYFSVDKNELLFKQDIDKIQLLKKGGKIDESKKEIDIWEKILFEYPTIKDEYKEWVKEQNKIYDDNKNLKEFLSLNYPEILEGKMAPGGKIDEDMVFNWKNENGEWILNFEKYTITIFKEDTPTLKTSYSVRVSPPPGSGRMYPFDSYDSIDSAKYAVEKWILLNKYGNLSPKYYNYAKGGKIRELTDSHIFQNQTALVNKLIDNNIIEEDEIKNSFVFTIEDEHGETELTYEELEKYKQGLEALMERVTNEEQKNKPQEKLSHLEELEPMPREIFEWIFISEWLARQLLKQNLPVIMNEYGNWWGRTTTDVSYEYDPVLKEIAKEKMETGGKVEGQEYTDIFLLWINNDKGMYDYWNERADAVQKESVPATKDGAIKFLADELKEFYADNNPLSEKSGPYSDSLTRVISNVNWREIAEKLLEEKRGEGGEVSPEKKKFIENIVKFKTPLEYQDWIRKNNKLLDYVNIDGIIFTQDEYDMSGKEVTYGNLEHEKSLMVTTENRYGESKFSDAVVDMDKLYSYRNDINYLMKTGGKVDITKNFYRFRQVSPKGGTAFAVPPWATKVAESVKKGAKITTMKKDGKWVIQSIEIPKEGVKVKDAKRYAKEIMDKLDRKKKALGGIADDDTDCTQKIEEAIRGIEALIASTTDEKQKQEYQQMLNDLQ